MKYINADKLKRFVGELKKKAQRNCCDTWGIVPDALEEVEGFIGSLQEEQTEIEKEAEISPSMVSNFGPCTFNLSVTFTQDEMEKMNIAPFLTKKVNVIIKDAE